MTRARHTLPLFIAVPGILAGGPLPAELKETYTVLLGFAWRTNYEYTEAPVRNICAALHALSDDALRARLKRLAELGYIRCENRPGHADKIILLCRYDPTRRVVLTPPAVTPGDDVAPSDVDEPAPGADSPAAGVNDPPRPHGSPRPHGDQWPFRTVVVVHPTGSNNQQQQSSLSLNAPTPRVHTEGLAAGPLDEAQEAAVSALLAVGVEPRETCEALVRKYGAAHCQGWAGWGQGRGTNPGGLVRSRIESRRPAPALSQAALRRLVDSGRATPEQNAQYYQGGKFGHLVQH